MVVKRERDSLSVLSVVSFTSLKRDWDSLSGAEGWSAALWSGSWAGEGVALDMEGALAFGRTRGACGIGPGELGRFCSGTACPDWVACWAGVRRRKRPFKRFMRVNGRKMRRCWHEANTHTHFAALPHHHFSISGLQVTNGIATGEMSTTICDADQL